MQTISISSFPEAFNFIEAIENGSLDASTITFSESINLNIKIDGDQWDGTINYKIASFILNLQKDILKVYNRYAHDNITLASLDNRGYNLVIKVTVTEGCVNLFLDFLNLLENLPDRALKKMESKHLLYAFVFYFIVASAKDMYLDKDKKYVDAMQAQYIEMITFAKETQTANVKLISSLIENNTIQYNETKFSKKEASQHFKDAKEETPITKTYYIDDSFFITGCDAEKQTIILSNTGMKPRDVSTHLLIDADKSQLCSILEEVDISRKKQEIGLQVSLELEDEKISAISVTSIGAKRESAISFSNAIQNMRKETEKRKNSNKPTQINMFDMPN